MTVLLLWMGSTYIYANEFPDWKDGSIQDESKRLSTEKINELNQELDLLHHPAKVFVLEQIDGKISDYIQEAFTHYQLPEDQLLVIFVMDPGQMAAIAGPKLEELGVTQELLVTSMTSYFMPPAQEGDYLGGIHAFVTQVYEEVGLSKIQPTEPLNEEAVVENPNQAETITTTTPEASDSNIEQKKGLSIWLYVLIGIVIIAILVVVFVYLRRKQLHHQLENLKQWKYSLEQQWSEVNLNLEVKTMQEEVLIRLSNLETTYEDYQNRIFPELQDDFKDANLFLSRYRIVAAKEVIHYIDQTLDDAAYLLEQLNNELHQIVEIKTELPKSVDKVTLLSNKLKDRIEVVAAQYGISLSYLRGEIQKKEKEIRKIQYAIENESSLDQHVLDHLQVELQKMDQSMNQIDQMSQEMEERIPNRLKELENKYKGIELEDSGQLVQILKEAREKWNSLITLWDEGRVDQLAEVIHTINTRLTEGESILQQESDQSKEIHEVITLYEKRMNEILEVYHYDQRLFEKLYRKYQIEDDPIIDQLKRIDETEKAIIKTYNAIIQKNDVREYKEAYQLAKPLPNQLEQLAEFVAQFHNRIEALSTEEDRYSLEIKSLRNRLRLVRQQLDRSLLPGKQDQILDMIDQGFKAILETEVLFDQLPLRLNKISLLLGQAREQVQVVEELTKKTISNAQETEEIIRRLNIYRTSVPQLAQFLMMAENAYRDQNFDEAVSFARKAEAMMAQTQR